MNIRELRKTLGQHDPDINVVLRHPDSGRIHVLLCLVDETAAINANRDLRCGPHNLTYRPSEKDAPILHLGQQSWYGDYPQTPDVDTAGKLSAELASRNQDTLAVITHHFDEFVDVDLVEIIENTTSPMLWGHPGSNLRAWPKRSDNKLPDRVLLISNSENEAYTRLRTAAQEELEAGLLLLNAERQGNQGRDPLPIGDREVTKDALQADRRRATRRTRAAWKTLSQAVSGQSQDSRT